MRDYNLMRHVLAIAAKAQHPLCFNDFRPEVGCDDASLEFELKRLDRECLIKGIIDLGNGFGTRKSCTVEGLTAKGEEFYRLIENDTVWEIIHTALKQAGIDVSYPLLKEVCEEVVKSYVTSFLPKIAEGRCR